MRARVIALYLPQFHPIPENDEWWGKGFTEWTNVAKARPLFPGHYQPHVPADLGFYDLRVPETREAQAQLAAAHGVEAFCYWHYWFAGSRLLERPFDEILHTGQPDFDFCLAWANQSWTGTWHGAPEHLLQEQTYPGRHDHEAHFASLLPAFRDRRYFRVNGRPLFAIFQPTELPGPREVTALWRSMAEQAGLEGLYLVGMTDDPAWNPEDAGFDAAAVVTFSGAARAVRRSLTTKVTRRLGHRRGWKQVLRADFRARPLVYDYEELDPALVFGAHEQRFTWFPTILPNWDNTPRSGTNGIVLHDSSPELFRGHVEDAVRRVAHRADDERIVFVKSWNEWAEGNHLEPDLRYGRGYLEVLREVVSTSRGETRVERGTVPVESSHGP